MYKRSDVLDWMEERRIEPCHDGEGSLKESEGQNMDEQEIRPRYRTATYDGYLSLPLAAAYLWRSRRGLRGRLSQIVYYRPDGRQIIFKKADSDAYMERFRVDPVELDELVKEATKARGMDRTEKRKK